jgi:hypothetical protein
LQPRVDGDFVAVPGAGGEGAAGAAVVAPGPVGLVVGEQDLAAAGGEEGGAVVVAEEVDERVVGVKRLLLAEHDDGDRQPVEDRGVGHRRARDL